MAEVKIIQCKHCKQTTRVVGSDPANCVWCKKSVAYVEGLRTYPDTGRCEKCGEIVQGICSDCKPVVPTYVSKPAVIRDMLIGPYITWQQFNADIIAFSDSLKGKGYDAVIGVPRSGLSVATQMSIRMGIPLYSIGEYGPIYLGGGLRVRSRMSASDPKKALLVEDSTASGASLKEAVRWMGSAMQEWDVHKAAVYTTDTQSSKLDEYYRRLELPHWFEWNLLWNEIVMGGLQVAVDFDGILCNDFTAEQDDDGWRYLDALKNRTCLIPSGTKLFAIITARLEKYRSHTERWLRKHGITVQHLIMGQWEDNEDRAKHCMGAYKAEWCRKLGSKMFIESCPVQARVIKQNSDIAVLCPQLGGSIAK